MKLRATGLSTGLVIGALIALGAMLFGGTTAASGANAGAAAKCKSAKNVQAIIDDSGSMAGEDPAKFRTQFLNTFANIGANNGLIFGGGEFGDAYTALFGPAQIPGVIPAMQASFAQVNGDSGGTDYQLAFAGGVGQNGTADARIFLTDGAPNDPNFTSHLSPPTKTYAVGIGTFAASPEAQAVLGGITTATGGPPPFLITDPSQVQPVAGAITALLNCKKIDTFTDVFTQQGDQGKHSSKAEGGTMDILTTWGTAGTGTVVDANASGQGGGNAKAGAAVAIVAKKGKGKVKVKKTTGPGFVSLKVKGLRKGQKVKIKVKAKTLTSPTTATTQVIK